MTKRNLHAVPASAKEPQPDLSYEYQERRRILSRDWASTHIASDKRQPFGFASRTLRTWIR